jgi:hypothetical protein
MTKMNVSMALIVGHDKKWLKLAENTLATPEPTIKNAWPLMVHHGLTPIQCLIG